MNINKSIRPQEPNITFTAYNSDDYESLEDAINNGAMIELGEASEANYSTLSDSSTLMVNAAYEFADKNIEIFIRIEQFKTVLYRSIEQL